MFTRRYIFLEFLFFLGFRTVHGSPCFPDQWEGTIHVVGAQMDASSQYYTQGHSNVAYDFTNQLQASNETFEMNGAKFSIATVLDYTKRILYEVKDGICTKTELPQPMKRTCVPDDAVNTGSFYLGVEGRATPAIGYTYNISAGTWAFMYLSPPTTQSSVWVPVAEIRQAGISGATVMSTSSFTNISLGIRDRNVFEPPEQCQHVIVLPKDKQTFLHSSTSKKINSHVSFFNILH